MAANDYFFQKASLGTVYLTRVNRREQTVSQDRRIVDEHEILAIFEHYLRQWFEDYPEERRLVVMRNGEPVFEAKLLKS